MYDLELRCKNTGKMLPMRKDLICDESSSTAVESRHGLGGVETVQDQDNEGGKAQSIGGCYRKPAV